MYCGNCGMENEKGAKFCKGCGRPLDSHTDSVKKMVPPSSVSSAAVESSVPVENTQHAAAKMKSLPKHVLAGGAVAGVILIAGGVMVYGSRKTINLDHYLTIDMEGYDGYGSADAVIDWDAIEKKYGSRISFTDAARAEFGRALNMTTPMEALKNSVYVYVDESSGLSNDDTISYSWEVDDDLMKYVDCKIKAKDGSKKVSGLEQIETFDAFADLDVSFHGRDADGYADLNYTGEEMSSSDFYCDKSSGLSNGDTVTVSISDSDIPYYAENLGKVPAELEKEYTVEGLEYYLKHISEISAESLAAMQQQASDVYQAKAAKDWGESETLESLSYVGDYLLTSKNSQDNYLYLVYKAQVRDYYSNGDRSYDALKYIYWYIRYNDLMVGADGSVSVDVTDYATPGNRVSVDSGISDGWWGTKGWYYYGYETLDALYRDVVTANLDSFNHEDNADGAQQTKAAEAGDAAGETADASVQEGGTESVAADQDYVES